MGKPTQRFDIREHKLWGKCSIGEDVYISDMARVRGRLMTIEIGDNASLADFVMLMAEAPMHIGCNVRLLFQASIIAHERVTICADVVIGVGAKILSGVNRPEGWNAKFVEIGTGSVISAGAVIMPGVRLPAGSFIDVNEVVYA
jgi:acetyltransferase-like isoleucine patch superfamily enzyme